MPGRYTIFLLIIQVDCTPAHKTTLKINSQKINLVLVESREVDDEDEDED